MKKFSLLILLSVLVLLSGCTVKINSSTKDSGYPNNFTNDTFFTEFDAKGVIRDLEKANEFMSYMQGDFTSTGLRDYFVHTLSFSEKKGNNQAYSTYNGTTYTFKGDGSCKSNGCYVTVNLYGDKGPNKRWTKKGEPQDIFDVYFRVDDSGKLKVVIPEFIDYNW